MASSKLPVYTALAANLLIAATKFISAAVTGSSAMLSEGIHSIVDTLNEILLLLGIKLSKKKPDEKRPFGYGKELYFWSFIVSILIFGLGGGISFYEGITHIRHPVHITIPFWNYIVLGSAIVFDGISLIVAVKSFNQVRGDVPFWEAIKKSKDPSSFVILFEDAADVFGLVVAFTGVYFGHLYKAPWLDGLASIVIGLVLTAVSAVLTRESRSLLMGETASPAVLDEVMQIIKADPATVEVNRPLSMFMGPQEIILVVQVLFKEELTTSTITGASDRIRRAIKQRFPNFKHITIELLQKP